MISNLGAAQQKGPKLTFLSFSFTWSSEAWTLEGSGHPGWLILTPITQRTCLHYMELDRLTDSLLHWSIIQRETGHTEDEEEMLKSWDNTAMYKFLMRQRENLRRLCSSGYPWPGAAFQGELRWRREPDYPCYILFIPFEFCILCMYDWFKNIYYYYFFGTGGSTQGPALARQAFYHLSHNPSPRLIIIIIIIIIIFTVFHVKCSRYWTSIN
jgi:hypothetical protein